jgi:glucose-6-phosphate 1-dehydrogenase
MCVSLTIFGASGDLTTRKLIPSLFWLRMKKRLPKHFFIIGISRTKFSDEEWREQLRESTKEFLGDSFDQKAWDVFAPLLSYIPGDMKDPGTFERLDEFLNHKERTHIALEHGFLDEKTLQERETRPTRVYYLSTAPRFYSLAADQLEASGMADQSNGPRRIVIEKPFGTDLTAAVELNHKLQKVFGESNIFRIDHYLGKETVNNLFVFRFANTIFEPIWNRNYISHVQITSAESLKIGRRAGYYDTAGVLRDMFQNHLLQLMTLIAMEAPARFEADAVRDEKAKVLKAVHPMSEEDLLKDTIRGQYEGYLDEPGVAGGSRTATFAAMKLHIDNWRWQGVPFFLRSGKAMSCPTTQILIQFRRPPHVLFPSGSRPQRDANYLLMQIQPAEGIQLHFQTKTPDTEMKLRMTSFDFRFDQNFGKGLPDAYERLLVDAINGDASQFTRSDEVENAWKLIDPIQQAWDADTTAPYTYEPGMWGPQESDDWMKQNGYSWYDVCPILT